MNHQSTSKDPANTQSATCPVCNKVSLPTSHADAPFCSRRCSLVDLGRWFKGEYRIPTRDVPNYGETGEDA
jgi:hypothetical protein